MQVSSGGPTIAMEHPIMRNVRFPPQMRRSGWSVNDPKADSRVN